MLSTPIVLKSLDSPLPLETATFVIHALYTEFVVGVLGFFSIHMRKLYATEVWTVLLLFYPVLDRQFAELDVMR